MNDKLRYFGILSLDTLILFLLLLIAVYIIFFTIGEKVEGEIVNREVSRVVNSILSNYYGYIPNSMLKNLNNNQDLDIQDKEAKENNKKIYDKITKIIIDVSAFTFAFIMVFTYLLRDKLNFKEIIKKYLLAIVSLVALYILFTILVIRNYIYVDTNEITYYFIESIKKNLKVSV